MRILECLGALVVEVDAEGRKLPDGGVRWRVRVVLSYKVRQGATQALKVDVYGRQLMGLIPECRVDLDNGIVMRGRLTGGRRGTDDPDAMSRCNLAGVDVEGGILVTQGAESEVVCDEVIVPLPSSWPLATGGCTTDGHYAQPGLPFSMTCNSVAGRKGTWTSGVLRLLWRDVEIIITDTNRYWKAALDFELTHDAAVMGMRKRSGGVLSWQDVDEVLPLMEEFIGWIGRCKVTIPHVRGYRARRVVYKGWRVRTHAATPAAQSWLPVFNHPDMSAMIDVQGLFNGFARAWTDNAERKGTLHLALQCLRGKERPLGRETASIMYLDHVVRACFLLLREFRDPDDTGKDSNYQKFRRCCAELSIPDLDPWWDDNVEVPKEHHWLWQDRGTRVAELGSLSRALANLRNALVHIDNDRHADRVMSLPSVVQQHLTESALWLAELLMLKVVGYDGAYYNRITMRTETVPWVPRPRETEA